MKVERALLCHPTTFSLSIPFALYRIFFPSRQSRQGRGRGKILKVGVYEYDKLSS